jgi:hypothetical protein
MAVHAIRINHSKKNLTYEKHVAYSWFDVYGRSSECSESPGSQKEGTIRSTSNKKPIPIHIRGNDVKRSNRLENFDLPVIK